MIDENNGVGAGRGYQGAGDGRPGLGVLRRDLQTVPDEGFGGRARGLDRRPVHRGRAHSPELAEGTRALRTGDRPIARPGAGGWCGSRTTRPGDGALAQDGVEPSEGLGRWGIGDGI